MRSAEGVRIRKRTLEESSNSGSSAHLIASSDGSSAHLIASSDDLLLGLLLRLPIKSLLKFKCVSKHWLSLITDPLFTHRKSLESKSVLYLFCQSKIHNSHCGFVPLYPLHTRARFLSLTFADKDHKVKVQQSCNGLLCCSLFREPIRTYYIYNPTTKQFRTLPPPQDHLASNMSVAAVNLAFDPSISHAYKVVCIGRRPFFASPCQILIYSSETGQWRVSGAPFHPTVNSDFHNGVYWNGAIHWMSKHGYRTSLYFDLNEELVQEMPMPHPSGSHEWIVKFFGESNGHLYLVEGHGSSNRRQLDVYEMERDRSGWVVKFQVDLDGVGLDFYGRENRYIYCISVLGVVRGQQEEDSFLVLYLYGIIIRYNFKGHPHRAMCDTWSPRYRLRGQTNEVIYTDTSRYNNRSQTRQVNHVDGNGRIYWWPNAFQIIESLSDV